MMNIKSSNFSISETQNFNNGFTVSTTSAATSLNFDPKNDLKKKRDQLKLPTFRFELDLEKPSSDKFNEYNYNKLVVKSLKVFKKQKNKEKDKQEQTTTLKKDDLAILENEITLKKDSIKELLDTFRRKVILSKQLDKEDRPNENGNDDYDDNSRMDDNLEDENDDVEHDLDKNSKKNRRKNYDSYSNKYKLKDFSYLGHGYDENDSFIDNSDAKDVRIPSTMAPKRGGFYINKEQLKLEKKTKEKKIKKEVEIQKKVVEENEPEGSENSYSGSEEYSSDDSEDEDDDEDDEDESDEGEEEEYEGDEESGDDAKTKDVAKIAEIDLASSNSSCQLITPVDENKGPVAQAANNNKHIKKSIKKINDSDDEEEKNEKKNFDTNKNKENFETNTAKPTCSTNIKTEGIYDNQSMDDRLNTNKKRKNEQFVTDSHAYNEQMIKKEELSAIDNNNIKKKKIDPSTMNRDSAQIHEIRKSENLVPNINQMNQLSTIMQSTSNINYDLTCDLNMLNKQRERSSPSLINPDMNTNNNLKNSLNRPNEVIQDNNKIVKDLLPKSISGILNDLIAKLIEISLKRTSSSQSVWSDEFKLILHKIYKESQSLNPNDRSQLFNYISSKINKPKDALLRSCRRMTNKELNSSSPNPIPNQKPPHTPQQHLPDNTSHQKTVQNILNSSLPITISSSTNSNDNGALKLTDLNDEIRNKLFYLENEYLNFKKRNELQLFFNNNLINNEIFLLDSLIRSLNANNQMNNRTQAIRNFCIEYLSKSFELNRESFHKKYLQIISNIREKNTENTIREKLNELKMEIDTEMPKNITRFNQLMNEYIKNKAILEQNSAALDIDGADLAKKFKAMHPRKKFEWTIRTKDLLMNIIQLKLSLFTKQTKPPVAQPGEQVPSDHERKLEFIKNFLIKDVLNLWPDNWMQIGVLLNMYNSRYGPSQQQQQPHQPHQQKQPIPNVSHNNSQPNQLTNNHNTNTVTTTTTSTTTTTVAAINISSKNGKQIKIEQQISANKPKPVMMTPEINSQNSNNNSNIGYANSSLHSTNSPSISQHQSQKQTTQQLQQYSNQLNLCPTSSKQNVFDLVVNQFQTSKLKVNNNPNNNSNNINSGNNNIINNNNNNLIDTNNMNSRLSEILKSLPEGLGLKGIQEHVLSSLQKPSSSTSTTTSSSLSSSPSLIINLNTNLDNLKTQTPKSPNVISPATSRSIQNLNSSQNNSTHLSYQISSLVTNSIKIPPQGHSIKTDPNKLQLSSSQQQYLSSIPNLIHSIRPPSNPPNNNS